MTTLPAPLGTEGIRRTTWIVAAVLAWTVDPFLVGAARWPTGVGRDCSPPPGARGQVPPGCPQEGLVGVGAVAVIGSWVVITGLVAVVLGAIEGSHRRFARGVVPSAVLVAVAAPWAMLAFAAGNDLGQATAATSDRSRRSRPRPGA